MAEKKKKSESESKSLFGSIKINRQQNIINQLRPLYLKRAEIRIERAPKGSSEKILQDTLEMQKQDDESDKRARRRE